MADLADRSPVSAKTIAARAAEVCFGKPLITNINRGLIAELIVEAALPPDWRWCAADYAGHDFEHVDGTRLEVKQSAARQSWAAPASGVSRSVFDIASRAGHWEGAVWIEAAGRRAQIYVFAHHPVEDLSADHRDPEQWRFYVVRAVDLPDSKTLALSRVRALVDRCDFAGLKTEVERLRIGPATGD
jgi:hypothetical protein